VDVIKIGMSAERSLIVPPERTVGHFVPRHADGLCDADDDPGDGVVSGDAINACLEPGWVNRRHPRSISVILPRRRSARR